MLLVKFPFLICHGILVLLFLEDSFNFVPLTSEHRQRHLLTAFCVQAQNCHTWCGLYKTCYSAVQGQSCCPQTELYGGPLTCLREGKFRDL